MLCDRLHTKVLQMRQCHFSNWWSIRRPYYVKPSRDTLCPNPYVRYDAGLEEAIICGANCRWRKLLQTAVISKVMDGFAWYCHQQTRLSKPFSLVGSQIWVIIQQSMKLQILLIFTFVTETWLRKKQFCMGIDKIEKPRTYVQ